MSERARPEPIEIRQVSVEFLRPGPPHNQLLSPLTPYLAICGTSEAGVVTVPYEQARFDRRLKALRGEGGDPDDRLALLDETGAEVGRMLAAVPGLESRLFFDANRGAVLVHLRLTLSASELAFLPFELSRLPSGVNTAGDRSLVLQSRPFVCLTRNVRTVSTEDVEWPSKPRILFIAAETTKTPYLEHRLALLRAIEPFRHPLRDQRVPPRTERDDAAPSEPREQFGELLTALFNPTIGEILAECRTHRYTHVHILAHGGKVTHLPGAYGLVLQAAAGDQTEVVSGERFANALAPDGGHRPTVVTVASCDSGNVGTVVEPTSSFAHALHDRGMGFVVASQFPLSKDGSVLMVDTLYGGLLWGAHPLVVMHDLRVDLHARQTANWHDWASLVVYEALPRELNDQLAALTYVQVRRALTAALERLDRLIAPGASPTTADVLVPYMRALEAVAERLPDSGQYSAECLGLRASAKKRLAQASFVLSQAGGPDAERHTDAMFEALTAAHRGYERAADSFLVSAGKAVQRIATLHWLLVQVVSLSATLGKTPRVNGLWETAKLSAERYLRVQDVDEQIWAHASLAELWLLRLNRAKLKPKQRATCRQRVIAHVTQLVDLCPSLQSFFVLSTVRQFERYVAWWGTEAFAAELGRRARTRAARWDVEGGLLETAHDAIRLMRRSEGPSRPGETSGETPGASSAPPALASASAPASTSTSAPPPPPAPPPPGPPPAPPPVIPAEPRTATILSSPRATAARDTSIFDIEVLPAGHGDCLWITYGDARGTHRWLMDCGTQATGAALLQHVEALPKDQRQLELFVLSHIDADHIGGALPFFKAVKEGGLRFDDVWFNGWQHISDRLGAKQGEMFSSAIEDFSLPWNAWRQGGAIVVPPAIDDDAPSVPLPVYSLPGGMTLTLLSPTAAQLKKLAPVWMRELTRAGLVPGEHVDYSRFLREEATSAAAISTDVDELADSPFIADTGIPNGTSIAVLAEFKGAAALLTADAHAPVIVESLRRLLESRQIKRLPLDVWKVSHHGSRANVSRALLDRLDCRRYVISTNGDHFGHPDREAIARIIKYGGPDPVLLFNYRSPFNEVWASPDLQARYRYTAVYPENGRPGLLVPLLGRQG